MNELIEVNYDGDRPTVLGRDLHIFLEVQTAYKDWFPRMVEYGFTEGSDFNPLKLERVQIEGDRQVARTLTDHQLTIPMAKELCMIQRTEKGKQARQYFLKLEEAWNTPEMVMARALKMADKQITQLSAQIEEDKPYTQLGKLMGDIKDDGTSIGTWAKLLQKDGINIGEHRLFEWLRNKKLLCNGGRRHNTPRQICIDKGLFIVKESVYDGHINATTLVTGKGQLKLYPIIKDAFCKAQV